ncbi:hypothetical protein RCL1_001875 [Eukaryota sp. TZLM3-RCL]
MPLLFYFFNFFCMDDGYSLLSLFTQTDYQLTPYSYGTYSVNAYCSIAASTDADRTGTVLWPATNCLLEFLFREPRYSIPKGSTIIELGCGIALPSLFLAKYNSTITTATDSESEVLDIVNRNAEANHVNIRALLLSWGLKEAQEFVQEHGTFDFVIGADVLYDPCFFDHLLHTAVTLLTDSPSAKGIIAYKRRSNATHSMLLESIHRVIPHCELIECGGDFFVLHFGRS